MNDIVYRSYENCRRPGVAILDMQMSKVPIISGYAIQRLKDPATGKQLYPIKFVQACHACPSNT